jgi:nitrite reductase (NO-forming)
VIGEIFDKVYIEGGETTINNVQTTLIPAGGSAITEMKINVPGVYNIVDHSIFRTFNKGTLAQIKASGGRDTIIFRKN